MALFYSKQRVVDCHLRNVYDFVHILQDTVMIMDGELQMARAVGGNPGAAGMNSVLDCTVLDAELLLSV